MAIKRTEGGVCAAKGFKAAGIHCGIRKSAKDLALLVSEVPCAAAGVYTRNLVKGAPVTVTQDHLKDGRAQAIICNSGNANTCTSDGIRIAERMCKVVELVSDVPAKDVIVASTGVIGKKLDMTPIEESAFLLNRSLGDDSLPFAEAIMTTDTKPKEYAVKFNIGGTDCVIGAAAKGVGMSAPNMATNLIFMTTDTAISSGMLQKALSDNVVDTFNMVSVDGDQSTNDMCCIMANGLAGNSEITSDGDGFSVFTRALGYLMSKMSKMIAKDGEGATKLIECNVSGAKDKNEARAVAKAIINSSLVKAAMFGADANWGRILCAVGNSGAEIDPGTINVNFSSRAGETTVCTGGCGTDFDEEKAKEILSEDEIGINISLGQGEEKATAWGCDLTYDYVKINGEYRT